MKVNNVVVFDLETSSLDINTTQILEIASVTIDPIKWCPIPNSEFCSLIRPDDESAITKEALSKNKLKIEDLRLAPSAKVVMANFFSHVARYGGKTKSSFTSPIPAGKNIRGFDMPIIDRYCKKYKNIDSKGNPALFNSRWVIDIEDDLFRWFGQTNIVDSISMDTMRSYFGIDSKDAHRALTDVRQTAWILCKFQRFYSNLAKTYDFAGSGQNIDFSKPLMDVDIK